MAFSATVRRGVAPRFRVKPPPAGGPYNASTYLTTPTPDGSGQATHPDVIDFGGTPWNGYRYWMALTPFASSNAALENPCILVSNDNTTWTVPPGGSNPIDAAPGVGFNSDPDLIYGQDGVMYCIYRQAQGSPDPGDIIYCRSSSNGVTWSGESTVLSGTANSILSPTIYWDGTQYVMLYVDGSASDVIMRRTCATITGTWSAASAVSITFPGNRTPWHIDAFKSGSKTYIMINEGVSSAQGVNFSVATATDGVTFTLSSILMQPLAAPLERTRIYRASGEISGSLLRLWYSAQGDYGWRVAYTEMPTTLLP